MSLRVCEDCACPASATYWWLDVPIGPLERGTYDLDINWDRTLPPPGAPPLLLEHATISVASPIDIPTLTSTGVLTLFASLVVAAATQFRRLRADA